MSEFGWMMWTILADVNGYQPVLATARFSSAETRCSFERLWKKKGRENKQITMCEETKKKEKYHSKPKTRPHLLVLVQEPSHLFFGALPLSLDSFLRVFGPFLQFPQSCVPALFSVHCL